MDNNGKPSKQLISQQMTQKIRNPELRNFIEESVDDCFEKINEYGSDIYDDTKNNNYNNNNNNKNGGGSGGNRNKKKNGNCEWAKSFAMCLEEKGKEVSQVFLFLFEFVEYFQKKEALLLSSAEALFPVSKLLTKLDSFQSN